MELILISLVFWLIPIYFVGRVSYLRGVRDGMYSVFQETRERMDELEKSISQEKDITS